MFFRKLSKLLVLVLAIVLLLVLNDGQAFAQGPKPPHIKQGMITNADRKAAADNLVRALAAKGKVIRPNTAMLKAPNATTMATPDYFGTIPNFANSPLPPSVTIPGDGIGAHVLVAITGGAVTGFSIQNAGSGYTVAPVNVIGGGGIGGTGTATLVNGGVSYLVVTNGGTGYSPVPTVVISGTNTTPASVSATVAGGVLTGFIINNAGSGYTTASVIISDTTGLGATANAVVADGVIGSIVVNTAGSGYGTVPGIRKFVDSLPGLGAGGANNLGQYIPVAIADTTTFPGSDYYEIEVNNYTETLHSDLPATQLRGYRQTNTTDLTVSKFSYLGPVIVSTKDRPVRIKFTNSLPAGAGGDLFIPVDATLMGAGEGPLTAAGASCDPTLQTCASYTENRATLHLHGGNTPWISDGTPHQWTTPATETTPYPKGVSVAYVPDQWYTAGGAVIPACSGLMTCGVAGSSINPGPGSLTFYYTNQQSARLLFYHDHAYGLTRLNVYVGEAAGYLVTDPVENTLVAGGVLTRTNGTTLTVAAGTIPATQIPLVIQDKTFVPSPSQLAAEDPTWDTGKYGGYGNLWFTHVYMPNQNPWDISGANAMGRWDYGPWFWPPYTGLKYGPVANPLAALPGEPPFNPGITNPSNTPESFMDTPLVNGTVYPYVTLEAKSYRFRILSAGNDRALNLQWYFAKSNANMWNPNGTLNDANAGEVNMVPATPDSGLPSNWPTDGRDGGVPDPRAVGPSWIQLGTEGGFLPQVNVIPPVPVGYNYNRRDIVVLNVIIHSLWLGPAERADVVVDFTGIVSGTKLILYNDSPAPVPAFDPRSDYYTGDVDQTSTGGAPTTLPGYGPNTRTIMQVQIVTPITPTAAFNVAALQAALPVAYSMVQEKPIVPQQAYDPAFNTTSPADSYARIQDTAMSFFNGPLSRLNLTAGGSNYTAPVTVTISGGGGTGATATATVARSVATVTLTAGGIGYTTVPTVTITGGGGTGATATAVLSGTTVSSVTVLNGGTASYLCRPTVLITGGGGTGATATANVNNRMVSSVTVTNGGSGYTSAPTVSFSGGCGGTGATARANLSPTAVASFTVTNPGTGYTSAPTVNVISGGGTGATGTAVLGSGTIVGLSLTNAGTGYTFAPTIAFSGGAGTGATATAVGVSFGMQPKAIQELFTVDYGKMNATLGTELPNTNVTVQTTIPMGYIDPPTEIISNSISAAPLGSAADGSQIWKITHNGVDSHWIHWHMFDVQVINRVGWDGAVRPPDANEMGWKDTVRMNPLEDIIVAIRPIVPTLPTIWDGLPNSIRALDVTMPLGSSAQFFGIDPYNHPAVVTNQLINYGWEYVWHCHILGHEENDMMRPIIFGLPPSTPGTVTAVKQGSFSLQRAVLTWTNNSRNTTGFKVERASNPAGPWTLLTKTPISAPAYNTTVTYTDTTIPRPGTFYYRVTAVNVVGLTKVYAAPAIGYPNQTFSSVPSAASNGVTTQ